jgi:outer membrane protein
MKVSQGRGSWQHYRKSYALVTLSDTLRKHWLQTLILYAMFPALFTAHSALSQVPVGVDDQPSKTITLQQSLSLAAASSPTTAASVANVALAKATVSQTEAARHFQLTFNSTGSYSNATLNQPPPDQESFGTVQNSLTIPLPIGSRSELLASASRYQLVAAEASYQSALLTLDHSVSSAFFDLLRQQALVAASQSDATLADQEDSDTSLRNKAGDVPQLDVLRAEVRSSSAHSELLRQQEALTTARETLNDLVGWPLDTPSTAFDDLDLPISPSYTIGDARMSAIIASPDVFAAENTVLADKEALVAATQYNTPALSLQALDARGGDVTSFSRQDTVQASVTVPLDDGGLEKAQIAAAQASLAQATAQESAARKAVIVAVSTEYVELQSSLSEVQSTQMEQALAQTTYDKTRLGYLNGLYPLTDVLSSESALAQAQTDSIQAVYDAKSASYALSVAVGMSAPTNGPTAGSPLRDKAH